MTLTAETFTETGTLAAETEPVAVVRAAGMPPRVLEAEIVDLCCRLTAGTCELLVLLGELDHRGTWAARGALPAAAWLASVADIDTATARSQVRVAGPTTRERRSRNLHRRRRRSHRRGRLTRRWVRQHPHRWESWGSFDPRVELEDGGSCSTACYGISMAREVNQRELRNESGEIMRQLDRGESFIVTRNGVPVGELTPLRRHRFVAAEAAVALFRHAPHVSYDQLRADLDEIADQSPTPRGQ